MDQEEEEVVSLFTKEGDKPADKPEATPIEPKPEATPAVEIPDKFVGKSIEEVVTSYVNLEKEFGNKSNEIGELRKLTDTILLNQSQQATPVKEVKKDVGIDDFIDDPRTAVENVLESNERIKRLESNLERNAAQTSRKELLSRHEDADAVIADPSFHKWIMENPTRQRILQGAHADKDAAAASDLLDMYKTTRKVATDNAIEERDAIAQAELTKATVERGSTPTKTKPTYKRAELIQLKIRDPQRYAAMAEEIRAAYAEKRVK